ncbi:MAG: coproporphyrinogen dehydrogenase HemZ [Clostridia bacterium]|nr:coproporphyrinogen dehydrogenase HemZ [Clostridia bacterium]
MMHLYINGNNYHYSFEQLLRVFMPDIKLEKIYNTPPEEGGDYVLCQSRENDDSLDIEVRVSFGDFKRKAAKTCNGEDLYKTGELRACQLLYDMLVEYSGYIPAWGIQTGVRPSKIYFKLLRNNTPEQAVKYLQEELFISSSKVDIVKAVCENELAIMESSAADQFSLFVSIPFCPSRCSYCSFISHSYESLKKRIPEYVNLLCEEIAQIASLSKECGLHLRSVYIGGGTPTVLEIAQLEQIFDAITTHFDFENVTEFTIEAGRPDTLDAKKLAFLKKQPVTRITVNAQSFNDEVLRTIGRNHTAEAVKEAYKLTRESGFDNINTDLIAGLEGESVDSFLNSVRSAIALKAENITIHTLALKRSSFLITRDDTKGQIVGITAEMIEKANEILTQSGYEPYYMYRQSKSVGNLENTGWALPGKACEYNVFMMEEVQHVFGAGAGAVTRLVNPELSEIKRIFNFKYPYEYIADFEQMKARKIEAASIIKKWQKP